MEKFGLRHLSWLMLLALGILNLSVAQVHVNLGYLTDGKDHRQADVLDTYIDCTSMVSSWNVTLNVTVVETTHLDVFHIFRTAEEFLFGENHYLIVDTSIAERELGSVAFDHDTDNKVYIVEDGLNSPSTWCCLIGQVTIQVQALEMTFLTSPGERGSICQSGSHPIAADNTYPPVGVYRLDEWRTLNERKARLILEVAESQKWTQFLVLYEKQFENEVRHLTNLASSAYVTVLVSNTEDAVGLKQTLLHYYETTSDFCAVLITSGLQAEKIFNTAVEIQMENGKRVSLPGLTKWLLVFDDGPEVGEESWLVNSTFDNVAVLSNLRHQGVEQQFQDTIQELYTLSTLLYKTGWRQLATVGSVSRDWILTLQHDVFPNVKFGFNGKKLIVSTNEWPPYVYSRVVNGTVQYYGFCMDLAQELSKTMNFTIEWVKPEDGNWGAVDVNGSWNGLVGQMQREEIDLIIAPIGVTGAREDVIDFSSAFFYDDSAVILKMPDPNKTKWRTYIDIFRKEVLMSIALALFLGSVLTYILAKGETYNYGGDHKIFATSLTQCVLYLYGAMLAQGGRNLPRSAAVRTFLSSWWLFCLVVAGTYSGNLIAVLTVTKDKAPFDTLEEMANQEDYKFGTLGNSMWTELFRTSPRPEFQAIHRKMQGYAASDPDVLHNDALIHLEKVKDGGYAYIADKGLFQSWLATNCDLILLKEKFFPGKYAIGLPNNSVYTKIFSDQVVKIYESGLLQVWIQKWWDQQTFCAGSLVTQARTLNLMDVQSSFYVLAIGAGLSLLVLVVEAVFTLARLFVLQSKPMAGGRGRFIRLILGLKENESHSGIGATSGQNIGSVPDDIDRNEFEERLRDRRCSENNRYSYTQRDSGSSQYQTQERVKGRRQLSSNRRSGRRLSRLFDFLFKSKDKRYTSDGNRTRNNTLSGVRHDLVDTSQSEQGHMGRNVFFHRNNTVYESYRYGIDQCVNVDNRTSHTQVNDSALLNSPRRHASRRLSTQGSGRINIPH